MLRRLIPSILLDPDPPGAASGGGGDTGGAGGSAGVAEPDAFGAFDKQFSDLESPPPAGGAAAKPAEKQPDKPPQGTPKPATPAPAGQKPAAPAAKPGAKAAEPAKPGEFEEVEGIQVPKFQKDGEFRSWGLNGYKKAKQAETELATLQTKLKELESKVPKDTTEREQLAARLTAYEKRIAEKEEQIKYLSYERSEDYVEKYQKPYHNAIAEAHAEVAELTVTEPDPTQPVDENGKRPTRERPATKEDFDQLYALPLGPATKAANEKFGVAAPIVLQHRKTIRDLAKGAVNALAEWKTKASEREKQESEQSIARQTQIEAAWRDINKRFSEDPRGKSDWGQEEDKEINTELEKGFALADRRFSDEYEKMPIQERVMLDAKIRHCVAGFYKNRAVVKKLRAELEQSTKDLAELRGSGPGAPQGGGEDGAGTPESEGAASEFDKRF